MIYNAFLRSFVGVSLSKGILGETQEYAYVWHGKSISGRCRHMYYKTKTKTKI